MRHYNRILLTLLYRSNCLRYKTVMIYINIYLSTYIIMYANHLLGLCIDLFLNNKEHNIRIKCT